MKALIHALTGAALAALASATAAAAPVKAHPTVYRTTEVEGLSIFYREAGPPTAPTVLMLHGFPSSSRMWEKLITGLSDRYHVIAPDYPGFGHSAAPPPAEFNYTFDHLAAVIGRLTQQLGLKRYALVMQDYGGPVGFRLAVAHPERVTAMVIHNAVAHDEGLGPLWETRRAYWREPQRYLPALRSNLLSLEAARKRHVGNSPHPELYDPDSWTDEFAFLSRPGEPEIQSTLFYDYRTNVAAYPQWQQWLRDHRPPLLVVWGRYDSSFQVAGAYAYKKTLPSTELHVIDAGHFPLDEKPDEVISLTRSFLDRHLESRASRSTKRRSSGTRHANS
jgi:pimeloyl-ACP methyl ester carboxylesterase